jgi:hypothetical protein
MTVSIGGATNNGSNKNTETVSEADVPHSSANITRYERDEDGLTGATGPAETVAPVLKSIHRKSSGLPKPPVNVANRLAV